jgi:uracil-DNA glycosylase
MTWSERQSAMLAEMGIKLWPEAVEGAVAIEEDSRQPAPAESPKPERLAHPNVSKDRAEPAEASSRPTPALRGNRPAGIEAMDWSALREAVAGCTACKLCESRRQTVFGVGNEQAHWMIVGEAPGEQEDIQGEPFVGKSGQLLDNMLRALGLGRKETPPPSGEGSPSDPARQVFIANTLKCRPPGNRNPQPEELAQCEHFLIRQIELVKPKIILAMGRFAVQSLLRSDEPIGRLRGRVHRYQGVPLIVTYHPAYLLRNLEDKARAWDDLCLAADTAASVAVA